MYYLDHMDTAPPADAPGQEAEAERQARIARDAEGVAEAEARADADAEADIKAGRVVPHERVREWLARLVEGEKGPPPSA
ncbi:MAG: hypothetical protein JO326_14815 [Acetobacteraceae bacterium]|nr:hypothetical protein [Acetobacteraceae bacterium]